MRADRRGTFRERGYSAEWDRQAKTFKREHPLCLGCSAVGRVEPTKVVDHIQPHRGDPDKMWDAGNWQPACAWHHDVVKQTLELKFERGQVGVEALRLDSPEAIRLTRAGQRRAIGPDGYPV